MDNETAIRSLDANKKLSSSGVEYWMARAIQVSLGYTDWRNFEEVIGKARMACEVSGVDPAHQFVETTTLIEMAKGAQRSVKNYYLSRYACYLIAMNGDPSKTEIAAAQTYFAVQTRRQEIADAQSDVDTRIALRDRVRDANKHLGSAAKQAGVQNYAVFHDAGYRGLYNMPLSQIKERKGLEQNEDLLDRAGRAELAANEFRITQTEAKITKNKVKREHLAVATHRQVGEEVRRTIERIGGTMPENLPAEQSIKKLVQSKKRQQRALPNGPETGKANLKG